MATIDDKIDLFAGIVMEKAETQAEDRLKKALQGLEEHFSSERNRIHQQARQMAADRIRKADEKKTQIISNARMEAQRRLFLKKEELLSKVLTGLEERARAFVKTPQYDDYLCSSIRQALAQFKDEQQLSVYFTAGDLAARENLINETIRRYIHPGTVYTLHEADESIIGGCICLNGHRSKRTDCTMAARLADSLDDIGRIVMEKLQLQVVSE